MAMKHPTQGRMRFEDVRPRPVHLEGPAVEVQEGEGGPAVVSPTRGDVDLPGWCASHRSMIDEWLDRRGALRFRGFLPVSVAAFRRTFEAVCPSVMGYSDRSSPRSEVEENLYTSTDHPPDQTIRMHCELSYSHAWPLRIAFFCRCSPGCGGETPLADTRTVLRRLSPDSRACFAERGVRYRRHLRRGVGLSWEEVFRTNRREEVERHCRGRGMTYRWRGDDLTIEWERPAIRIHPRTGEPVWFNHASFFHQCALDPAVAASLGSDEELPFGTSFGDGTPIPSAVYEEIESAYRESSAVEPWMAGDIVLLDNMLTAHGRNSFRGPREVYVMMGDQQSDRADAAGCRVMDSGA